MQVSIDMGATRTGQPAALDLEELLATRLLVQGNSGSGKSHLLRRLLEQSATWVQQAVVDPEGDFVTLADRFGHVVIDAADHGEGGLQRIAARVRQHRVSVVLNLEGLDAEQQMRHAAAFLGGLFDTDRDRWYPMLVVVDEAQLFAPTAAGEVSDEARKLSLGAMTAGGVVAGLAVALMSGLVARATVLREDASLAAFYLVSLALGVLIVSTRGSNVDLLHVLFGTVLALDDAAIFLIAGIASITLAALAILYRPLVLECLDPAFLRSVSRLSPVAHHGFLVLVVLNLVGGFHALGTLMAVGIMILPAAAARFWARDITGLMAVAIGAAFGGSVAGLLLSYHVSVPSGPAIILTIGLFYGFSLLFGRDGAVTVRLRAARHLEA